MKTGLESLDVGAPEITYSGNQGPKSPQEDQQKMAEFQMQEYMEEFESVFPEMKNQRGTPEYDRDLKEYFQGLASKQSGGIGDMAMKSGLIDEYRNYKMGQGDAGEQFMSPRDYYKSQEQDRAGVAYGGTAHPTYTQSRKQRMAYGGIAGLDGRKRYGIGSWFQENVMDPVKDFIPNEIKDNPIEAALIAAGLSNQFDLVPDSIFGKGATSQNWIGDLLGGRDAVIGGTRPEGQKPLIDIGNIFGGDNATKQEIERVVGGSGAPGGIEDWIPNEKEPGFFQKIGQTIIPGGETGYFDLYGTGDQQYDSEGRPKVNWKGPLAIGAAAGAAQKLIPQAPLPTDTSGIDMASAIRGDNLRFRPRDEVLAASGGRIGYDNGGVTADASGVMSQVSPSRKTQIQGNEMADQAYNEIFQKFYEKFPGLATGEETMAEMIAMLQAEGVMETENLGILGLDRSMDMITPESAERSARRISMGDTQYGDIPAMAQGGRIRRAEGGLMNLGGMEKDYRAEGGFVPIGGQERADDVPARLSKNEFVFTADAVRSAGGGDIDAGAEVMENVMNNLEQGGQISQESQGLEGARNMFATAQRLGEVI